MGSVTYPLRERDWSTVEREYFASNPFNYAVVDDFLEPDACEGLRQQLLDHWDWHYKSPQAKELYLRQPPDVGLTWELASALKSAVPRVIGPHAFVEHWAFMHNHNSGLVPHSDVGAVSVDLWLTPEQFNADPQSGGLILYDVKRPTELSVFEFQTRRWAGEYLLRETRGRSQTIGYAFNRAIIFDARTFHRSDRMSFGATTDAYRMNFSLLFDDPVVYRERPGAYARRFEVFAALAAARQVDVDSLPLDVAEELWKEAGARVKP
jgi:hypothetical protein